MKKAVILSNHHSYTYNFRKEIIQMLIDNGYKVYLVLPYGDKVELLKNMGCEFIEIDLDRRGTNPLNDLTLLKEYYKILKGIKPELVLSYTIKPNIYGGMACRILNIPFFPNVTGLGSAVENESKMQKVLIQMYKVAFKKAKCVFFQNEENRKFFTKKNIRVQHSRLIPGSGVNTEEYKLLPYPPEDSIEFVFISRIMKEKGIDQYLDAAKYIKNKYSNTKFHILGFSEENYESKLNEYQERGIIEYHGMQSDIKKYLLRTHCTIHPTYYPEGMSNVLLESAASGRPIITTDRSGCREVIDHEINGYIIKQQNSQDLIDKIEDFIKLIYSDKMKMGIEGRKKIEAEFDRRLIVEAYMEEVLN